MYADFESILGPAQSEAWSKSQSSRYESGDPNPNLLYTHKVNRHTPSGWCVYSKFAYGNVNDPLKLYRGKECVETFCNHVNKEARRLYHMFPELPMEPLTRKQFKRYKEATRCHICYKPFTLRDPKVRDHCHYTGLYRGSCPHIV